MQVWCKIIYLQYLSTIDAKFCLLCLRRLICNRTICVKIVRPQHTRTLWPRMPPVNCVSDALLNAAVQNVLPNIPMMLHDVSSIKNT